MVLNGNHKGEKCLIKENHCLSSDENTADFWKKYEADLAECQETKVVHMGDVDFFVEIYVKNPQLLPDDFKRIAEEEGINRAVCD